ncbi:endonuclease MutS2 [Pseudalkalibacillus berkeleyi]|uniref:Endonuclease MutS2 n=1 Tax=Pseudalkalibacillus berkeleyi TaxID=1069813 RepID=A0ABS9GTZ3_9BACL|nr:endonuclease MutS2 [Pseudalkalibacillus berkeleyi]MCF6136307.1 endonuclease MutS2 [Pseudalkalibacillus berkeleyi]
MNHTTEMMLEFNKIKEQLSQYTLSAQGKALIDKMHPYSNKRAIEQRLMEVSEAKAILQKNSVPIHGLSGTDQLLGQFNKGIALTPNQLEAVLDLIDGGLRIKQFMKRNGSLGPTVSSYADSIYDLKELGETLRLSIRNGQIQDHASKELAKLRKQISTLESRIKETVYQVVRSSTKSKFLQEPIVSQRDGRYVVPVKKEYRKQFGGQVIDASASGSTIYMEPKGVQKDQTKLAEVRSDEYLEEQRILSILTGHVEGCEQELRINIETMAHYDFIFAKAKFSDEISGNPVHIIDDPILRLKAARHPLLREEAKPLSLELGSSFKTLVITGPNTGGKTVTLKTAGLITMMTLSGLHVPASNSSEVGIFESILTDIGDGQSIQQSLSTFSSRLTNVIEILKSTNRRTLVLLDELGAGTDPAEGMGLAIAILEQLNEMGAKTIATTHYNDIKTFAAEHPDFENARMEFDLETLKPLYQLTIGKPGNSQAFHIARKLGLHPVILAKAHERTYGEQVHYDHDAIQDLQITSGVEKKIHQKRTVKSNYKKGDSVFIPSQNLKAIVYKVEDENGEITLFKDGELFMMNYKRVKLDLRAEQLYPEGYDFDILFESVENRKKKRLMEKRHVEGLTIEYPDENV